MAIIKKVWQNKSNGQKLVTIPKDCEIEVGDSVKISKIINKIITMTIGVPKCMKKKKVDTNRR